MNTLYIAADISQASFVGAVWHAGKAQPLGQYANDEAGFAAFAAQVAHVRQTSQATTVHLILEPTGGYELKLALFAYGTGWLVSKPNPRQLRQWAQGMNFRTKTDPVDSRARAPQEVSKKYPGETLPARERKVFEFHLL